MSALAMKTRIRSLRTVLTLVWVSCDSCDPWTPDECCHAHQAGYLAVTPDHLEVFVSDPAKTEKATFVAIVYDQYGRVLAGESLNANLSGGTSLALGSNGTKDTLQVEVKPATTPGAQQATLTVSHPGSGLSVAVDVVVRYASIQLHGVGAEPRDEWPMIGLATGRSTGNWTSNQMWPFVRRYGFAKFDTDGMLPPLGDVPSGSVLSSSTMAWRKVDPWIAAGNDVTVPGDQAGGPANIVINAFYAGSNFEFDKDSFRDDLQAAGDILAHTWSGVMVTIKTPIKIGPVLNLDSCDRLGQRLAALPVEEQPSASELAVYMISWTAETNRAFHCGPGTMGPIGDRHAIFLPQGVNSGATIAHEVGHALGLSHVSSGSGFFDDNLMVETDDQSARLRSRFTVGQSFRAAMGQLSWLTRAGLAKSAAIDCDASPPQCPYLGLDALARQP